MTLAKSTPLGNYQNDEYFCSLLISEQKEPESTKRGRFFRDCLTCAWKFDLIPFSRGQVSFFFVSINEVFANGKLLLFLGLKSIQWPRMCCQANFFVCVTVRRWLLRTKRVVNSQLTFSSRAVQDRNWCKIFWNWPVARDYINCTCTRTFVPSFV